MEEKKVNKPFCLAYAEAKNDIIRAVNKATQEHNIPCFLLEGMMENILSQIKSGAIAERAEAERAYKKQLEESEKKEGVTCKKQ